MQTNKTSKKHIIIILFLSSLLLSNLILSSCSTNFRYFLEKAEAAEKSKEYSKAIEYYNKHIEFRNNDSKPPKENPYFYLLMVGDLYLKNEQPIEAKDTYIKAVDKEVSKPLCAERIRNIAKYYSEKSNYEEAFKILEEYRELDPLLFDLDKDNLHKEYVLTQESAEKTTQELAEETILEATEDTTKSVTADIATDDIIEDIIE